LNQKYFALEKCPRCSDPESDEYNGTPGFVNAERGLVMCECQKLARVAPLILAARLPRKYHHATISGMNTHTPSEKYAHQAIKRWLDEFHRRKSPWLLLFGPPGTGKTRIQCALCINLIKKHPIAPLYWSTSDLVHQSQRYMEASRDDDMEDPVDMAKRCDLLAYDDLGAEYETKWSVDVVAEVLDSRYLNGLPTLISTNLSMDHIADRYGVRTADRIQEMAQILTLDGPSRREKPNTESAEIKAIRA